MSEQTSSAVVQQQRPLTPAQQVERSIVSVFNNNKAMLQAALPKHLTADRMIRLMQTCFRTTPKLLECDKTSVVLSIVQAAQLGLEPGTPLGQAYLIPRKLKGVLTCTMMPGYRGLLDLARRSGKIKSVEARVVREGDEFRYAFGLTPVLEHRPLVDGTPGAMLYAYAVIHLKDGGVQFDVMTRADIERIKEIVKKQNGGTLDGPWTSHEEEMWKKTVLKRALKLAPASIEFANAAAVDDGDTSVLPSMSLDLSGIDNAPLIAMSSVLEQMTQTAKQQGAAENVDEETGEVTDGAASDS